MLLQDCIRHDNGNLQTYYYVPTCIGNIKTKRRIIYVNDTTKPAASAKANQAATDRQQEINDRKKNEKGPSIKVANSTRKIKQSFVFPTTKLFMLFNRTFIHRCASHSQEVLRHFDISFCICYVFCKIYFKLIENIYLFHDCKKVNKILNEITV